MILAAAELLLTERGWRKTTVAGIARHADVAVGSVYLEFDSKERIMRELSGSKHAQILRAMRRAAMGQGSHEARLLAIFTTRSSAFLELSRCAEELVRARCEGVTESLKAFEQDQHELLSDFLIAANEAGEFSVRDVESATQALLTAYSAFTPPALLALPPSQLVARMQALHTLLVRGLLTE